MEEIKEYFEERKKIKDDINRLSTLKAVFIEAKEWSEVSRLHYEIEILQEKLNSMFDPDWKLDLPLGIEYKKFVITNMVKLLAKMTYVEKLINEENERRQ